ncbi:DmsC/YnfH family molybdoenzyme membrane anchor subunit [Bradyrhizobium sp.]|uniref:DmsC/YnfH family molybdoenzyme membrane anchor subunit n=1 Tax=Bradyrhizobium sp. TaxID=376 RepID=UPI00271570FC|nr:DmsC/YnfH family molybdoenzyme membrane anchor subunit [Bradyrhizobium sp.]MDO9298567.1 DmsC/YnfH family molybdoenzyme membrane anchor subunit [Bradyrhizobium sp.]
MSEARKTGDRVLPRQQSNWDARAAANFICGGAGGGLLLATALASVHGEDLRPLVVVALALVGAGLLAVWFEIGRPWRALNVYLNAATSWMSREAMIAPFLFASGAAAVLFNWPLASWIAGLLGLLYLYCQARMLHANKGIPAWRHASCVGMMVATGVVEGAGLLCAGALYWPGLVAFGVLLAVLLAVRLLAWRKYLASLRSAGVPVGTSKALNALDVRFVWLGHAAPAVLGVVASLGGLPLLAVLAGVLAAATGAWFKYTLVCRAAFTQGFALPQTPSRGGNNAGPGVQPGWNRIQPE